MLVVNFVRDCIYAFRDNQSVKDENEPGYLTVEDWEQLNNIIGYKEGDDEQLVGANDKENILHTMLEVHMRHNASKLTDAQECLAELSCDSLDCLIQLYSETKIFDLKLGSYRLSSPNGLLVEVLFSLCSSVPLSICNCVMICVCFVAFRLDNCSFILQSATTRDSLTGVFCYKPFDVEVDWSLIAKASPCYATVCYIFSGS